MYVLHQLSWLGLFIIISELETNIGFKKYQLKCMMIIFLNTIVLIFLVLQNYKFQNNIKGQRDCVDRKGRPERNKIAVKQINPTYFITSLIIGGNVSISGRKK